MKRHMLFTLAVSLLITAGCTTSDDTAPTSTETSSTTSLVTTTAVGTTVTTSTTTTEPTTTTTTLPAVTAAQQPREIEAFASLTLSPIADSGTYPGPSWPTSLDEVVVSPQAAWPLQDETVARMLIENGFIVVPTDYRLFQDVYAQAPYDNHAVFVTADVAYHYLHLAFSKVLRDTEEDMLLPVLEDLVMESLANARAQEDAYAGTPLADMASRVTQLFEAAGLELNLDVGQVGQLARAEVDLADEAVRLVTSPISGFTECNPGVSPRGCVDYSLFKPRGHYTRSEALEQYFVAMSILGQEGASFVASDTNGTVVVDDPSMQFALLLSRAMDLPEIERNWKLIYEPTAFMVGLADDYTPYEVAAVDSGGDLTDPAYLQQVGDALLTSRSVGINPEAASVRIMGARFVIDSYILDQLAWPNVGQEPPEKRRVYVSPLDVASAMGSDFALDVQLAAGEDQYLHYDEQMGAMRTMVDDRTDDQWAATVYDAWLAALEPVWRSHGTAYPPFMQSDAWTAKSLATGLGSYAELKHDTILYAKQAFAAEGGGDWLELEPRHWVEPEPAAFERVSEVAGLLQRGLDDRGLLNDDDGALLSNVRAFADRLGRLAGDELAGRTISEEDNTWLGEVGSVLEGLWYASSDVNPDTGAVASGDSSDALIADIARSTHEYLEIGTGAINTLVVLVPNDDGVFQAAVGGVYSYYEFWRNDTDGRLTDEEWWEMLDNQQAPDRLTPMVLPAPDGGTRLRPAWQSEFLAP